jgi:hypothetical protein
MLRSVHQASSFIRNEGLVVLPALVLRYGNLTSGLYVLLLSDGKQTARGRVVIE